MIDDAIYLRKGKGRGKSPEDTMKKSQYISILFRDNL